MTRTTKGSPQISWLAKLKPADVRKIRKLSAQGWSQKRLAEAFGISQSSVCNLLTGRTYRQVA